MGRRRENRLGPRYRLTRPTLSPDAAPSCSPTVHLTRKLLAVSHQDVLTSQSPLIDDALVRAVADPLRAQILDLLATEQLCTCHLVELTGARQTNISNHLRVLRDAGLVEVEPAGRYTYYRLVPERFDEMAGQFGDLAKRARRAAAVKRPCG